jgi:hypothetical protein
LNTRKPEQQYRVVKFDKSSKKAIDYCANIFDRYELRPFEHPDYDFVHMCLLEFAMLFEPYYAKQFDDADVANHPTKSDKTSTNFFLKIMADTERPQKFLWTFCLNHE